MTSVEFIKRMCRDYNIPISRLERDCGFSNGYISHMRNGSLPSDRLVKISEYLHIPVEDILAGELRSREPARMPTVDTLVSNGDVIIDLMQAAMQANPDDVKMASDMLKRLSEYRNALQNAAHKPDEEG